MSAEIHVGDVGTVFEGLVRDELGAVVDLSSASAKEMVFRKPSGKVLEVDAGLLTDGQDGVMTYASVEEDLDESGDWQVQGFVTIGTWTGHTDVHEFRVHRNLR
jgi:hypothetical protein